MKSFAVIACVLVAVAQAQYAPSGWKPQGARLALPTEYGAPNQQEPQKENLEIEITHENVEYVGQLGETTTVPSSEYLPPTTTVENAPEDVPEEDPLAVQGLPERDNARRFQQQQQQQQRAGRFRQMPLRFQQEQRFARVQNQPKDVYGPPTTTPAAEEQPTEENLNETESEVEVVEDEAGDATIAVANSGQYYVLAPDNTLQKVSFYTRQTDDDRQTNGFTAQLRYAPVEPIRDPIYAYNEQGQLVRVYNKKK